MGPYRASDETPEYRSIAKYDNSGKTLDQRVSDSSPIGQQSLQAGPSRLLSKGSASQSLLDSVHLLGAHKRNSMQERVRLNAVRQTQTRLSRNRDAGLTENGKYKNIKSYEIPGGIRILGSKVIEQQQTYKSRMRNAEASAFKTADHLAEKDTSSFQDGSV